MDDILWDAIEALASAINLRARNEDHSVRVARYAVELAGAAGYSGQELERIRLGALLHDIGQIVYTDALVEKQGEPLTEQDLDLIHEHPTAGVALLRKWHALRFIEPYVLYHQEWIDGSGYPYGVAGDHIPREVQIVSIADVYEALSHPRPYRHREGLSHSEALAMMRPMAGRRWEAHLFELFAGIAPSQG